MEKFDYKDEDVMVDLVEGKILGQDLNAFFNLKSPSVFLFRVGSDALLQDGIYKGDFVICDRSKVIEDQQIIVIAVDGKFYIRRFIDGFKPYLQSSNDKFKDIDLQKARSIETFGVVTGVIRKFKASAVNNRKG